MTGKEDKTVRLGPEFEEPFTHGGWRLEVTESHGGFSALESHD